MTNIIGHDIDGRPLRAGDEVVIVISIGEVPNGSECRIVGVDRPGWLDIDYPGPEGVGYICEPSRLRKLHNDHRPADESFHEMIGKLNGEVV